MSEANEVDGEDMDCWINNIKAIGGHLAYFSLSLVGELKVFLYIFRLESAFPMENGICTPCKLWYHSGSYRLTLADKIRTELFGGTVL